MGQRKAKPNKNGKNEQNGVQNGKRGENRHPDRGHNPDRGGTNPIGRTIRGDSSDGESNAAITGQL